MASNTLNSVPMLNSTNCIEWSTGINAGTYHPDDIVDITKAIFPKILEWEEINDSALGVISVKLPLTISNTVFKLTAAAATWKEIEKQYGTPGAAGLYGIFQEVISFEITENIDPSMLIASLMSIFN
ncbi:hypothetical protein GYMLUDRAFT_55689 [Collybiopsis luxurians FD-317 M1]|nr:hypothetical protein GYMLUDRAFT_55689 [Collybiopsis luxurians FD-317 M1]